MSTHNSSRFSLRLGAGWMVIATLFFALMGVFVKLGAGHFHFIELVFWRGVFGVVLMAMMARAKHQSVYTPLMKQHLNRSISGFVAMLGYFYAMTHLPLASAVTLSYTSPIGMIILSFLFYKEQITKIMGLGILIGFVGVLLLLQPNFNDKAWVAVLIGLGSGLLSGWAYIQVQQLTRLNEPEWRIVFYFSLVCAIGGAVLSTLYGWSTLTLHNMLYIVGMGVCATIAQMTMTKAYSEGNKFVASSFSYLTIVFSSILGALILHDVLRWQEFLAMLVIIASGFVTKLGKPKPL
ncbi:DMT family transporter [Neisseria sp. Ec49-e6-T10]|uniref:DMT family transporter n=1 Tax=Neisseria sp. Ec49-e6-T10 TaxID=3140744 RepID=UPI003EB92C84